MPFDATPSENPENTGSKTTLPDSQSDCSSLRKYVKERLIEESQPKTYIEPHVSLRSCTENGKFIPQLFVDFIASNGGFVTQMTSYGGDTILTYNPKVGIWEPNGIPVVEIMLAKTMREEISSHYLSEVIKLTKVKTYKNSREFVEASGFIVLKNGVLDLSDYRLKTFDPTYNALSSLPVEYKPQADCIAIKKFISEVAPGDEDLIQEWFGFHLLKDYRFQKILLLVGVGNNGKSTLLQLLERWLGRMNCSSQTLYQLSNQRFSVAELYGKLANIAPDLSTDELKRTGMLKALTGGDTVSGERKNRHPFSFINHAKLTFSCNQLPTTPDQSDAFFRRFLISEFKNTFEGSHCDPNLIEKLTTPEELSGLLNWAIEGLRRLLRNGQFSKSKSTYELRDLYLKMADPITAFINKCLTEDLSTLERKSQVYYAYSAFCRKFGYVPQSDNIFAKHLLSRVHIQSTQPTIEGERTTCWKGIALNCKRCKGCKGSSLLLSEKSSEKQS